MKKSIVKCAVLSALVWHNVVWAQSAKVKQPEISFETFEAKLKQAGPNAQILDPRAPEEFKVNHLKGAIDANLANEDPAELQKIIDKLDKQKPVFVYGINYGGRGSQLAKKLKEQHFNEVYELPGGISKWIGAGQPVESTTGEGLSSADYKKLLVSGNVVLVDVYAKHCGTCKKLLPIVDSVANDHISGLKVVKIDLFENNQLGKELNIESVPTLILYKDGKVVWQKRGLYYKAALESFIQEEVAHK